MNPFVIQLPAKLGDKDLVNFFRGWTWFPELRGEVIFDFNDCGFLAPWAITLFSLYALWLHEERGNNIRVKIDPATPAGRYLVQAGALELFGASAPELGTHSEHRTTQLTRIRTSAEIPAFAKSVLNLLNLDDEELEGAVEYSLIELLRNVVQHANSPVGGLSMAQYFPMTGIVEVAVADMGDGIRETLLGRYPEIDTDLKALKFALLPHVSGTFGQSAYGSMLNNAGLGLFFVKEITTRAAGGFFLGSGNALVDLWGNADGSPGRRYVYAMRTGWPGTFAVLQLRRSVIGDFASLLTRCRDLAAEARKDPTELSLDFIDEVPELDGLTVVHVAQFEEDVEEAARVRENVIVPGLQAGEMVVLDFSGIRFATQSFAHACMYRVLRDCRQARTALSLAGCTDATREAIKAVAAYAKLPEGSD